jgi:hypothetical protein
MTAVASPSDVAHPITVFRRRPTRCTRSLRDASLKKAVCARLGSASFWLADPARDRPSLRVFELAGGAYREVACVAGDEAWTAGQPFPVRVVPADLVRGLRPQAGRASARAPGRLRPGHHGPGTARDPS